MERGERGAPTAAGAGVPDVVAVQRPGHRRGQRGEGGGGGRLPTQHRPHGFVAQSLLQGRGSFPRCLSFGETGSFCGQCLLVCDHWFCQAFQKMDPTLLKTDQMLAASFRSQQRMWCFFGSFQLDDVSCPHHTRDTLGMRFAVVHSQRSKQAKVFVNTFISGPICPPSQEMQKGLLSFALCAAVGSASTLCSLSADVLAPPLALPQALPLRFHP